MTQGVLPYTVEVLGRVDTLTARAGLPLVLETMRALGLDRVMGEQVRVRQRASGYPEAEKLEALVLRLAAGGDGLDDIEILKADAGLARGCWGGDCRGRTRCASSSTRSTIRG